MDDDGIITGRAYVYFAIRSETLTKADCAKWLEMEPVETHGITSLYPEEDWKISTPMTEDPFLHDMIRAVVDQLIPIKDRLLALKETYPEVSYVFTVVLDQGHGTAGLSLYNDTLLFLAEIGVLLSCDIYRA